MLSLKIYIWYPFVLHIYRTVYLITQNVIFKRFWGLSSSADIYNYAPRYWQMICKNEIVSEREKDVLSYLYFHTFIVGGCIPNFTRRKICRSSLYLSFRHIPPHQRSLHLICCYYFYYKIYLQNLIKFLFNIHENFLSKNFLNFPLQIHN